MRWAVVTALVAACSFHAGEVTGDATTGGDSDARAGGGRGSDSGSGSAGRGSDAAIPDAPPVPIVFKQGSGEEFSPTQSAKLAFAMAETAGDLNVVVLMWGDQGSGVSSVTDSAGNTYTEIGSTTVSPALGGTLAVYYAANIAGGSDTITVDYLSSQQPQVSLLEYTGIAATDPIDVTVFATGSGATANSGSGVTNHAHDLIVGAVYLANDVVSPGTGFTARLEVGENCVEDMVVTSTGSYEATATQGSGQYMSRLIAFKGE